MRADSGPIAVALNTRPKYVASTTLTDPQWTDTTVLSGDLTAAVGELKAKPGGELQVHGSGNLVRWLVDNHWVEEITLLTYPVVVGQGTRLFPATGPDTALGLGRLAGHPQRADDPGLPAHRAPAVRNGHGRPEAVTHGHDLDAALASIRGFQDTSTALASLSDGEAARTVERLRETLRRTTATGAGVALDTRFWLLTARHAATTLTARANASGLGPQSRRSIAECSTSRRVSRKGHLRWRAW